MSKTTSNEGITGDSRRGADQPSQLPPLGLADRRRRCTRGVWTGAHAAAAKQTATVTQAGGPKPGATGGTMGPHDTAAGPGLSASDQMDAMHEKGIKAFPAKTAVHGNQLLKPKLENGVKVFELTAAEMQWETAPEQMVSALAYNGHRRATSRGTAGPRVMSWVRYGSGASSIAPSIPCVRGQRTEGVRSASSLIPANEEPAEPAVAVGDAERRIASTAARGARWPRPCSTSSTDRRAATASTASLNSLSAGCRRSSIPRSRYGPWCVNCYHPTPVWPSRPCAPCGRTTPTATPGSTPSTTFAPDGYRLVAAFDDGEEAVAVAGFRLGHNLAVGRASSTSTTSRRCPPAAGAAMARRCCDWIFDEAQRLGCDEVHLDSGTVPERWAAHRLYHRVGMNISSHHFTIARWLTTEATRGGGERGIGFGVVA